MHQGYDALARELLADLGLPDGAARLVAALAEAGELTSRELEVRLGVPQPRVSALLRDLAERGWVDYRVEKRLAAGRPRHLYRMRKPLSGILEDLKRVAEREHARRLDLLERLLSAERRRAALRPSAPENA